MDFAEPPQAQAQEFHRILSVELLFHLQININRRELEENFSL